MIFLKLQVIGFLDFENQDNSITNQPTTQQTNLYLFLNRQIYRPSFFMTFRHSDLQILRPSYF